MRLLVTGGTGVLGRALAPLAEAARHERAEQQTERFARAAGWHPRQ